MKSNKSNMRIVLYRYLRNKVATATWHSYSQGQPGNIETRVWRVLEDGIGNWVEDDIMRRVNGGG